MTPIPLHRVATALPFTDYLHRLGAPVARELRRAKLPVLAMDDPDCFIPTRNYWNFVAEVARREGIDDLGFLVGQHAGADAADPDLSAQLEGLPTLHHALNRFCKLASTEISAVALWLAPTDRNRHRLYYRPSYGCDHPAFAHFQWYGLMAAIGAIRLFAGKKWLPDEIGLAQQQAPADPMREAFQNTRFHAGQAQCFIELDNGLLFKQFHKDGNAAARLARKSHHPSTAAPQRHALTGFPSVGALNVVSATPARPSVGKASHHAPLERLATNGGEICGLEDRRNIEPADDLSGALKQVLRSYLLDGAPTIGIAAGLTGHSVRTLQRQLAKEGLTYRGLLEQVRFETAIDLLRDTDCAITYISHVLGYSDPSHFARAFQRTAGVAPRVFRKQHQH